MGKEALGQSVYPGGEYQYKSTDKNVIDKLYSVSVMRHIVSIQDDYLVTFEIVGEENEKQHMPCAFRDQCCLRISNNRQTVRF